MNFYRLKIAYYELLYRSLYSLSANKYYDDNILISGTTRGGTTWLMEMLWNPDMQVVWEPTKYETLVKAKGKNFANELGVIPYIPLDAGWDEAHDYFEELLSGYRHNKLDDSSHPLLLTNPWQKNRLLMNSVI
jgi:hypothetical protein